jgi:hypothetical protein
MARKHLRICPLLMQSKVLVLNMGFTGLGIAMVITYLACHMAKVRRLSQGF